MSHTQIFDDGPEHTTVFNYNSDMSGDVTISYVTPSSGKKTIQVPGRHLLQFVANIVRQRRISVVESNIDYLSQYPMWGVNVGADEQQRRLEQLQEMEWPELLGIEEKP